MAVGNDKRVVAYTDFTGGELAPAAQGHTDSDIYNRSAKTMVNCQPSLEGGLTSRKGFRHVFDLPEDVTFARVFALGLEGYTDKCVVVADNGSAYILDDSTATRALDVGLEENLGLWNIDEFITHGRASANQYDIPLLRYNDTYEKPWDTPAASVDPAVPEANFPYRSTGDSFLVLRALSPRESAIFTPFNLGSGPSGLFGASADTIAAAESDARATLSPYRGIVLRSGARWAGLSSSALYFNDPTLPSIPFQTRLTLGAKDGQEGLYDTLNPRRYVGAIIKQVDLPFDGSEVFFEVAINRRDNRGDFLVINDWGKVRIDFSTTYTPEPPPGEDNMSLDGGYYKTEDLEPLSKEQFLIKYRVKIDVDALGITQGKTAAPGETVSCYFRVQAPGNHSNYPMQDPLFNWIENQLPANGSVTWDVVPPPFPLPGIKQGNGLPFPEQDFQSFVSVHRVAFLTTNTTGSVFTEITGLSYDAGDVRDLQFDVPPEADAQYFTTPLRPPRVLFYDRNIPEWSFDEVDLTQAPPEWVATKYPTCVAFFQGRSWWGGVSNIGYRLWASQPGDYLNFEDLDSATPTAKDALRFDMADGGRIHWLKSRDSLLIGTSLGEVALRVDGAVSALNLPSVVRQSGYGSILQAPVEVGDTVYFLDATGKKIRATKFSWEGQTFVPSVISTPFSHLVNLARDLYFDLADESITYVSEDELVKVLVTESGYGTSHHNLEGRFISACPPVAAIDTGLFAIVQAGDSFVLLVEDEKLLDFYREYYVDTPGNVSYVDLAVPDEFNGDAIALIGGDVFYPTSKPNETGVLELVFTNVPVSTPVFIGRAFSCAWEPLPPVVSPSQAFSTKQPNQVMMRLHNSAIPYVNGTQSRDQVPGANADSTVNNLTDDVVVGVEAKEAIKGLVRLTQPNPVPFNISAVFVDIGEEQL